MAEEARTIAAPFTRLNEGARGFNDFTDFSPVYRPLDFDAEPAPAELEAITESGLDDPEQPALISIEEIRAADEASRAAIADAAALAAAALDAAEPKQDPAKPEPKSGKVPPA